MYDARRIDLLVLDDDSDLADAIALLLETACVVRVTNDVEHARLELERRAPDCLLCDHWLGNVSSTNFLRWVVEEWPCTRRVLMSASPPNIIQPVLDEGLVDAFLAKPFHIDTAVACIRTVDTLGCARGGRSPSWFADAARVA